MIQIIPIPASIVQSYWIWGESILIVYILLLSADFQWKEICQSFSFDTKAHFSSFPYQIVRFKWKNIQYNQLHDAGTEYSNSRAFLLNWSCQDGCFSSDFFPPSYFSHQGIVIRNSLYSQVRLFLKRSIRLNNQLKPKVKVQCSKKNSNQALVKWTCSRHHKGGFFYIGIFCSSNLELLILNLNRFSITIVKYILRNSSYRMLAIK